MFWLYIHSSVTDYMRLWKEGSSATYLLYMIKWSKLYKKLRVVKKRVTKKSFCNTLYQKERNKLWARKVLNSEVLIPSKISAKILNTC